MPYIVEQVSPDDIQLMRRLLATFADAFNDVETYNKNRPGDDYLKNLLESDHFIALAAIVGSNVAGGLVAYELNKFEQERSEFYIYDLAVDARYRRQGIATALIQELQKLAAVRGVYVIFVQADTSPEDEPAIALYSKLGVLERVLHFDIPVAQETPD